ncbi:tigger transposable element-derived protein 1-like [Pseudorca crassidens]|uniref:tigger transposable element-derived protein 1-like n=1 Tax=Pseudorca crassidens TaxID=82174 RepID=UPI00352E524D
MLASLTSLRLESELSVPFSWPLGVCDFSYETSFGRLSYREGRGVLRKTSLMEKTTADSEEEVKISTLTGVWKNFIPALMDDFEGFKASVVEVTADGVEIAGEPELEVEYEDVTDLLEPHDKTLMNEELLPKDVQRKCFLEMKSTPSEDALKLVEQKHRI